MTDTIPVAEWILSKHFGCALTLRPHRVWDGKKSTVLRCRILESATGVPSSVIIKRSTCGAALEDQAASLFLEQLPHEPPFAPRCYGGDPASQTIVLEDLGDGDSPNTYKRLLGADPEEAAAALLDHIRLAGQLHAATVGRQRDYARIRSALGPITPPKPLYQDPWSNARGKGIPEEDTKQAWARYRGSLREIGLTVSAAVSDEIEMVTDRVEADPGPFLVFCQGDLNAPGNCVRQGGRLRLFDFDSAGFRHSLLEGLAGRLTWGCMSRIPADVVRDMDAAYRTAFQEGCAVAREECRYREAFVEAAARWHIFHVIWRLPTALEGDYLRGLTSLRQQLLAWLDGFVQIVDLYGHTPALGASARALVRHLRAQWPAEVGEFPFYPAFRRYPSV
jgi:hypothetical protein